MLGKISASPTCELLVFGGSAERPLIRLWSFEYCRCGNTLICTTSFTPPPFGERCEIVNSVRVSNLAWLPPTVDSNYSEWLWLYARTFLVTIENRLGWPGESNWRHTLPLLPLNYASHYSRQNANTTLSLQRYWWNLAVSYGQKPYDIWQRSRHYGRGREAEVAGDIWLQPVAQPASPPPFGKI